MKMRLIFLMIPLVAAPVRGQNDDSSPVYRDAVTHGELASKAQAAGRVDKMGALKALDVEDPSVTNRPSNIIEQSDILTFNGMTTLIPKRAIIRLPEAYEDRINNHIPGSRIVNWPEFFRQNRGWITTVEVSRPQAEGKEPIAEERAKRLDETGSVVVAVYSGGPISMLPPKQPEKENPEAKSDNPSDS